MVWTGVLGEEGVDRWVKRELAMEELGEEAFAPSNARPVSVRLQPDSIAMLDAFAERFGTTRSGMLLRIIQGGLAAAFHALPEKEQDRMCETATRKALEAGWKVRFGQSPVARRIDVPGKDETDGE